MGSVMCSVPEDSMMGSVPEDSMMGSVPEDSVMGSGFCDGQYTCGHYAVYLWSL